MMGLLLFYFVIMNGSELVVSGSGPESGVYPYSGS
jgi:hypothetical protein